MSLKQPANQRTVVFSESELAVVDLFLYPIIGALEAIALRIAMSLDEGHIGDSLTDVSCPTESNQVHDHAPDSMLHPASLR